MRSWSRASDRAWPRADHARDPRDRPRAASATGGYSTIVARPRRRLQSTPPCVAPGSAGGAGIEPLAPSSLSKFRFGRAGRAPRRSHRCPRHDTAAHGSHWPDRAWISAGAADRTAGPPASATSAAGRSARTLLPSSGAPSGFCRKVSLLGGVNKPGPHFQLAGHPSPCWAGEESMTVANEALRSILPIAGWSDRQAADVMFTGGADPVLPTPFRIGAAGAAALAATGLAASELWQIRTGQGQTVTVDLRQATASLRSGRYLKLAGSSVSSAHNSIMGVYPTRDGRWSYLHCNFPNHRAAALAVLGVAEDPDAVARAVATWNAAELEEAIIAADGAGGMARTQAEWREHPQAAAIARLPLLEIIRIGDSDPEPLPAGNRPLSNVRVLDLTRVLAGPTCARTLAEHGADVMKITAAHLPNLGHQEWDTGHGKLSVELDLRTPGDLEILRGLVREADVFS